MTSEHAAIRANYGREGLQELILEALRGAGKDIERLDPVDLAPLDNFHIRGREATLELADLAGVAEGCRVLDIGGGMGGPARLLASERGARVDVVDLSEQFIAIGRMLTERTGLAGKVTLRVGDATALPFEDATFDVVWTQHAMMNIADKPRVYSEAARVLRPGGRFAFHDILAGDGAPLHFPVPWAADPSASFLATPAEVRTMLSEAGLRSMTWQDDTDNAKLFFAAMAGGGAPPPLGVHLLMPDGPLRLANVRRNIEEGHLVVAQGVFERP